ncbi:MAG TPA: ABC transporter permease [Lapillicoccus sp.]|jgi:ABC-2 type transport system permease protein|uniref:ABC transporter permease n=1 Tax=Lapillicoccus sp. TaxID=1909287 RepID=UPI002F95F2A0
MTIDTSSKQQAQDADAVEAPRSSGQPIWPIVMMREIVVKLRDRNFVVGTVVTLLLLAGGLAFQAFMSGKSNEVTVAVSGDGARQVMQQVGDSAEQRGDDMVLTVTDATDPAAVDAAVRDGKADVGLVHGTDGWQLVGKTDVKSSMTSAVTESVRDRTLAANAQSAGTTVAALTAGGAVTTQLLEPDANDGLKIAVGLIFAFLFYFASIMFGMAIATSVVEEKQSRVVEILVSAVPLRQLLAGKVLGNTLLALGQMVLFVGVGLVGMAFTSYAPQIGLVAASAGWFLVFFVAGFAALACLWAVAGSLATRSEDLQSTTPVLTTILMVAMFVGLFGEGTVRVVGSYLPVVSAISMPQRLLAGEAAWWEPILSLLVTLAFAAWTMVIGERLYRRSILNTGRRLGVREALKVEA